MLKILVCHSNMLVRAGLRELLRAECRDVVFGEAPAAAQASIEIDRKQWDVAIFEVADSDVEGYDTVLEIRRRRPSLRILVLSAYTDSGWLERLVLQTGTACVSANASRSELLKAFKCVVQGTYLDRSPQASSSPWRQIANNDTRLSAREHDVLLAVAAGKRIGEIASELKISVKTVSTYKRRVLDKLGLQSSADLIRYVTMMKYPARSVRALADSAKSPKIAS